MGDGEAVGKGEAGAGARWPEPEPKHAVALGMLPTIRIWHPGVPDSAKHFSK